MANPTFRKAPAHVQPPPGTSDVSSGMQPATINGTLGYADDTAETELPGSDIGAAEDAAYHERQP